jgi:hypothetical protein
MLQYDWRDIDFAKIDAEGEEGAIIRGGKNFFQTLSPLIQYEVKAGNVVHLELIREFAKIGYASYRLLPGLNVLVPFVEGEAVDGYLLNLFCCKPDRAASLAAEDKLVLAETMAGELSQALDDELNGKASDVRYGWQGNLAKTTVWSRPWRKLAQHGKNYPKRNG